MTLLLTLVSIEATGQDRVQTTETTARATDFVVRFGAGASWAVFFRPDNMASNDKLMTGFSVSWAPFGLVGEIGADMVIGRAAMFVFHPNLKFFFVKHHSFSLYFEGSCDVLSLDSGVEVGGGGGLGMVFGIVHNVALEIKANASIYSLSKEATESLFGRDDAMSLRDTSNLMIIPTLGAKLLVRF